MRPWPSALRPRRYLDPMGIEERPLTDEQRLRPLARGRGECRLDLDLTADLDDVDGQSKRAPVSSAGFSPPCLMSRQQACDKPGYSPDQDDRVRRRSRRR
jgi:hypothetical protein